jgi:centrosomal protein CEP104
MQKILGGLTDSNHSLNLLSHCKIATFPCRDLHLIPVHLSRPLTSSTHPRLALSRLEMVEQLVLNHGISTEKQR